MNIKKNVCSVVCLVSIFSVVDVPEVQYFPGRQAVFLTHKKHLWSVSVRLVKTHTLMATLVMSGSVLHDPTLLAALALITL